ncbi:MAG: TlpA disulfide reductase family protein [Cocleimonas sp.]
MFFKKILTIIIILITISSSAMAKEAKAFDLSAYQGKVVMLDFWASWCVPCRKSFPWLNKMQSTKSSNGLVIIGINVDEDTADAERFLNKYVATFKLEYDPEGKYASYYDIPGMPTSLIFDRNGKLIHQHSGFKLKNIAEYESAINGALAK